jgi:rhamnose utilization protein RhaD (predicted bifunctional aldolase and dehydrogenase)
MEWERHETADLRSMRHAAAAIGRDSRIVQGAGGNVSVKIGEVMWIKASGTWLAEAALRDIMVPVLLSSESTDSFTVPDWDESGLRPSIETSMHAALPHAVVLHVHSVDAIALAVRTDSAAELDEKLAGLRWAFVPYARPGAPLTQAIAEATPECGADVLILANHGLVVAAPTVSSAEALLVEVIKRLAVQPRSAPPGSPAIAEKIAGCGFRPVTDSATHALATDSISLKIAESGILYPDQVVFLGRAPLAIDSNEDFANALAAYKSSGKPRPKWAIVRGVGVAIADDVARGGEELLRCLADVAARIPAGAELSVLTAAEIKALTEWDAEQYRQQMAPTTG